MLNYSELFQATYYAILVFVLLLVLSRLIGRKLLGQLTFFDFVTGITLGTIGGAFVTTEIEGYYVLASAMVFALLAFLTGIMTYKNITARKLIEGEPIILIQNGKIYEKNMKKVRYNQDDLLMQLRENNVFNLADVEFAILEPHGRLSVLRKKEKQTPTLKDLNLPSTYEGLSTEIIRNGRIQEKNMKDYNLSYEWLYNELMTKGVKSIKEVFLATLSTDGVLYVDLYEDNPPSIEADDDDSVLK